MNWYGLNHTSNLCTHANIYFSDNTTILLEAYFFHYHDSENCQPEAILFSHWFRRTVTFKFKRSLHLYIYITNNLISTKHAQSLHSRSSPILLAPTSESG